MILKYNNNMDAKILVVEDEEQINRLIELVLQSGGYRNVLKAFDGKQALDIIKNEVPDLVLLDVMLPEIDGLTLCRIIKEDLQLKDLPVIMLTAKKLEDDVLKGFESGAIDYITKPFSNKILLARINAQLQNKIINKQQKYKNFVIDENKHLAMLGNDEINLTNFEFEIMQLLVSNQGRVFSRGQLLSHLRGADGFEVSERAMDVQILNLRRKLKDIGSNIETVRGVGYRLKEDE